ncbi:precorrin-8X methylmutase [Alphaproteobacteria bacterium]|jgi:precorrin-8X/cobalt-precorrin-8 methylmutase|nr:precorrin-8X methylmutase [Alphaproteobacteria bacterium]MDA7775989.1 precorrin-8X methylmutase [Alphaproteobacteria bacterium]MDB0027818.1 precorrin-8X methylmutase [Alphaproteobacteria bacterium]HAD73625.1 precorrin-8X methylmutase [Alphaproteobacteria bacterium]|tara:strand:+ start:9855 stop:10493 length:639 start_codon:yes stop_codon:yes gene_type:complete
MAFLYEKDPAAIYDLSFQRVKTSLVPFDLHPSIEPLITRLVHACGMPDIVPALTWDEAVIDTASAALQRGAPILCDCEMVAAGITRRFLPADNQVTVTLNDACVPALAKTLSTTRSAAAVTLWEPYLDGAIIAIGNAPTALFAVLELIERTRIQPAAILGFPVGFVGAAESKDALCEAAACPFITLTGTRGGSALASAAVNALCRIATGDKQ